MRYNEEDIEFASQLLTHREELDDARVEEWMKDLGHVALLRDLVAIRLEYFDLNFEEEKIKEYARLREVIGKQRKRKLMISWSVAASVILCFVTSVWYLTGDWNMALENEFSRQAEVIQPKDADVELILATGERVLLDGSGRMIEDRSVSGIKDDSLQGLTYLQVKAQHTENAELLYNTLKVPTGGFYQLELSDGTRVWLNAESELRFPVQFVARQRDVYLKGEAYFDVKKDAAKPFVVHLNESHVTVLGTSFNIKAYGNENRIYTTLVEGRVRFTAETDRQQLTLKPGMQSVLDLASGKTELKEVDVAPFIAWKDGRFVFELITLDEMMRQLKRWYDIDVVYQDERVKKYEFWGTIDRNMSLDKVLAIVAEVSKITFDVKGKTVFVATRK